MNGASHAGGAARLEVAISHKDFAAADGRPRRVLENFELTLAAGAAGAVVGPSGCGKTTLLRIIAGLDRAFSGRVSLPEHGRLGMVFQEPRLLPWRNVEDNLRIAAPQASEEEIAALLLKLELDEHRKHFPGELSLGLARRAAVARALAAKPALLLLDEPFVSLDAPLAKELRGELAELIEEQQMTTLIVTHDVREAIELADEIFLLSARPARVCASLSVREPRQRLSKQAADALEAQARAALDAIPRR
ncbi:MAG: ABC transporter ATP-binding protein [Methylocystis sp.]|nr:ABC transporter ATP-binding protein [Methylocystis sp.]